MDPVVPPCKGLDLRLLRAVTDDDEVKSGRQLAGRGHSVEKKIDLLAGEQPAAVKANGGSGLYTELGTSPREAGIGKLRARPREARGIDRVIDHGVPVIFETQLFDDSGTQLGVGE